MPSMPLQGAAMHSRGLFMGGGGHQLAVQLTWLMFVICWSLLFTLPVCVVLMMLGAHPCTGATVLSASYVGVHWVHGWVLWGCQ